ncbi:MAG TPA: hypothetical protein VJ179_01375 [Patescibacteria group bacterium]|nr:hypothetical protein [Patescibacteria group bacterium]
MTPLVYQGVFHIYLNIVMFLIGYGLLKRSKESGDRMLKYIAFGFFAAGIEYLFIGLPLFFFPYEFYLVKMSGFVAWILSYFTVFFMWYATKFVYQKFPVKPMLVGLTIIWSWMLYRYLVPFQLAFINEAGIMDWAHSQVIMVGGLLFMGTYLPYGVVFIIRGIQKKLYFKAFTFGLGFAGYLLFLPLTYQVETFPTYIFMTLLAGMSMTLVAVGVLFSHAVYRQ